MKFSLQFDGVRSTLVPIRTLTPEDGHYVFGYYDLMPYSPDGRRHLAHRLPFDGRLNAKGDMAELGFLEDGHFTPFLETDCWSFQQGAMLQYAGNGENTVFYNIFDGEASRHRTVRHDLDTGERRLFDHASGCISRDGRFGLGINFSRIWDFRPGYGYPNLPDPYAAIPHPEEDGVFLTDFKTGSTRMLWNCRELYERFPLEGRRDTKMVVNHITFNPGGTRYLFLYRNFKNESGRWLTTLFSGDLDGNLTLIFDEMVSHYWWEDDIHMIAYCRPTGEENGVYRVNMVTGDYENIGLGELHALSKGWDIHCSLSPDGRYLIGDDYPDKDGFRRIFIQERATGRAATLVETYSPYPVPDCKDARCDLHARWNRDGSRISFDAVSRGRREIFEMDMTGFSF